MVLYTLHDAYKDPVLGATRLDHSDFSVPLVELEKLVERMGLLNFVKVTSPELRAASLSYNSVKMGDLTGCPPNTSALLRLVHLADSLASQQTARDFPTTLRRLSEISQHNIFAELTQARVSKRLGEDLILSKSPLPLTFYYHELDDYRGLSTLLIHRATEQVLTQHNLYPILYFANGILYIGAEGITTNLDELRARITTDLFAQIKKDMGVQSLTIARSALDPRKGLKFEKYAYLFCSLASLVTAAREREKKSSAGFISNVALRFCGKKVENISHFFTAFNIPETANTDEAVASRWYAASNLVLVTEQLALALVPGYNIDWLYNLFQTPPELTTALKQNARALNSGGMADYCFVIAYYWLIKSRFTDDQRFAIEVPVSVLQDEGEALILRALQTYDRLERRMIFVEQEIGLESDALSYISSALIFSFAQQRSEGDSVLKLYEEKRGKSHKRVCLICNRPISNKIDKKSSEIKTGIADQQALIFSNKLIPTMEVNSQMVWCPMCYLEFMLRKLSGQSFPENTDYNASIRLYLYALPDYSFTPQLWTSMGEELMRNFEPDNTHVSRLQLRGTRENPSLPYRWLEERTVDLEWLNQVREMFVEQAARMQQPTKEGKPPRKHGDRLTFSFKHPNYTLVTYDNAVMKGSDQNQKPTHTEVWVKALYAAALIHLLTGARVYITDKPYLNITRPEQMKTIIETEGLHPALAGLLPVKLKPTGQNSTGRIPLATLPILLDLLSAVWEINAGLNTKAEKDRFANLDKRVSHVFEALNTNRLAGATLYKERERNKVTSYQAFTRACQILLPQSLDRLDLVRQDLFANGYRLMLDQEGAELMNLAKQITDLSLRLYLPSTNEKGRAFRYENIFRNGVEALKSGASFANNEELVARVGGYLLKRLGRSSDRREVYPAYGKEQAEIVAELAELMVTNLFVERCGRSLSKLTQEENRLADAVYFITSQQIYSLREQFFQKHKHTSDQKSADVEQSELAEVND